MTGIDPVRERRQEPARQPASTPKFPVSRGAATYALVNRAAPLSRDRRPLRVLRNQNQRRSLAVDERQRSLTPGDGAKEEEAGFEHCVCLHPQTSR
jgi:hypothetical protein